MMQTKICKCGCGKQIKGRGKKFYNQKHYLFFIQKNGTGKKYLRVLRKCACGCGGTFVCICTSAKRYINHHNPVTIYKHQRRALSERQIGEGNITKRPEVAEKISKALRGRKDSPEVRRRKSEGHKKSRKFHTAMRMKIGKGNPKALGKKRTKEFCENVRKRQLGQKHSESHCKAISNALCEYFNNMENRVKRAKDIAARIKRKGYQYKTGCVTLPRLGITLNYRSSYELLALLLLDSKYNVISVLSEVVYIPYTDDDGKERIYIPDLLVVTDEKDQILIEIKPKRKYYCDNFTRKVEAACRWCEENDTTFCIWNEDVLHDSSSTTTSLQVIVEATVAYQNGRRYSLNSMVTWRDERKLLVRPSKRRNRLVYK